MSEIRKSNGICTQINVVRLPADNQDEVLKLMIERAHFMATQPGFVSVNLHRSKDGSHVVNYVQWTSADKLAAAHHAPEFRKKMAAIRRTGERGRSVPLRRGARRSGVEGERDDNFAAHSCVSGNPT
jgi:heme-degrading monooxygenase HmoA